MYQRKAKSHFAQSFCDHMDPCVLAKMVTLRPWLVLFCFLLLLPPSLWRWNEDLSTSKKTDNLANLCFSLCIRCHRLSSPFCSAHSPACSLTRPRLHKIVLLRQRKMPMSIRYPCPLFYLTVMCLVAKFSRATSLWLIEEGKYRRQSNPHIKGSKFRVTRSPSASLLFKGLLGN